MDLGRARVKCSECENHYWIELDGDLIAIPQDELFEHYCPHCSKATWVEFESALDK